MGSTTAVADNLTTWRGHAPPLELPPLPELARPRPATRCVFAVFCLSGDAVLTRSRSFLQCHEEGHVRLLWEREESFLEAFADALSLRLLASAPRSTTRRRLPKLLVEEAVRRWRKMQTSALSVCKQPLFLFSRVHSRERFLCRGFETEAEARELSSVACFLFLFLVFFSQLLG